MKKMIIFLCLFPATTTFSQAQLDKDQLALNISKTETANTEKLKSYVWKRKSVVAVGGQVKLTTITDFSFDSEGKLQAKIIDAETTVKKKPGIRGSIQENAAEEKLDYVQKALSLSLEYTFMTKGELLDFFSKATVTEKDGIITAKASDVHVKGDKLTIVVDAKTNLYIKKVFSSLMGTDQISGEINYETFESGVNHGSTTVLNMPAQDMKIDATNQDYSLRVK